MSILLRKHGTRDVGINSRLNPLIPFDKWNGWENPRFKPAHFYQTKEWFHVLTETWPTLSLSILPLGDNSALPIFAERRGFLHLAGSPLRGYYSPYGGYLGTGGDEGIPLFLNADFCEIALSPGQSVDGTWKRQRTIIIDLTKGIDALFLGMEKETRNQVRQSSRNRLDIREFSDDAWIDPYYKLVQSTYLRQDLPVPASKRFYINFSHYLVPAKAKVLLAYLDDMPVAGGIFSHHEDTIYFFDGASDRQYQNLRPNHLIQWQIIQWAVHSSLTTYDMVGANIPSIARFKRGFGGVEVTYPALNWTPTLKGKLSWQLYQKLRRPIKKLFAQRFSK